MPFIAALGCGTPPALPEETLEQCVDLLIRDPKQDHARALFPLLLRAGDEETMNTMRAHHGTGKTMMDHNYPSHRWIHPFLRGWRFAENGDLASAEVEFEAASAAALTHQQFSVASASAGDWSLSLAAVIVQESRLRLEELRGHR